MKHTAPCYSILICHSSTALPQQLLYVLYYFPVDWVSSPDQKEGSESGTKTHMIHVELHFLVPGPLLTLEQKLYNVATLTFELLLAVMEDGLFLPWWGLSTDDFISHDHVFIHEAPASEAMIVAFLRAGARSETAEGFIAGKRPAYILLTELHLKFAEQTAVNLEADHGFCIRTHAVLWRASFCVRTKNLKIRWKYKIFKLQITVGP